MSQSVLELLLWIVLSFFVGCIVGYVSRMSFGASRAAANSAPEAAERQESEGGVGQSPPPAQKAVEPPKAKAAKQEPAKAQTAKTQSPKPQAAKPPPTKAKSIDKTGRPKGIAAPRAGSPDKLQRISGVGPKIELTLHRLGIFHFDQIAEWTAEQEQWVDDHLKFKGRITREEWIEQARLLAGGKEEEYSKRYGGPDHAESKTARSRSGARTSRAEA